MSSDDRPPGFEKPEFVSTIVPMVGNKIYLARQRQRPGLSYSGLYTLYYTKGGINEAVRAFENATMNLLPIVDIENTVIFPKRPLVNYYITSIDALPHTRRIFERVAKYFSPCFSPTVGTIVDMWDVINSSEKGTFSYDFETLTPDIESCEPHSFERDDLLIVDLNLWNLPLAQQMRPYIYALDLPVLDQMAYSLKPTLEQKLPRTVRVPRLLERFPIQSPDNVSTLVHEINNDKQRNYHQVGIIPIAERPDGVIVVLASQERYENLPWSFFTGKPLNGIDILRMKRGETVAVDYYRAALREYYEESMDILNRLSGPFRELFVRGRDSFGTNCALWPVEVEYEEDIGIVYQRIANYVRVKRCINTRDGKMRGPCAETHVEKINAKWLTVSEAISWVKDPSKITRGVNAFRSAYLKFLSYLNSK